MTNKASVSKKLLIRAVGVVTILGIVLSIVGIAATGIAVVLNNNQGANRPCVFTATTKDQELTVDPKSGDLHAAYEQTSGAGSGKSFTLFYKRTINSSYNNVKTFTAKDGNTYGWYYLTNNYGIYKWDAKLTCNSNISSGSTVNGSLYVYLQ